MHAPIAAGRFSDSEFKAKNGMEKLDYLLLSSKKRVCEVFWNM